MANIKFSQFTVGNTESDIDFVVGYKGANNIQISPGDLLSSTLSGYLPLTGGTMTGNIILNDAVQIQIGSGQDLRIVHDGTDSFINSNGSGDLYVQQFNDDKDIIFKSDHGSGGVAEYFKLDGQYTLNKFSKNVRFIDSVNANFGDADDLRIYHNGTNSNIENFVGSLQIIQNLDDGDISFKSDDGSGGTTEYFRVDGGLALSVASKHIRFEDSVEARFGTGGDARIFHDATDTYFDNFYR